MLDANFSALWIANFGTAANGTSGDVQVLNNIGATFTYGQIKGKEQAGFMGQALNEGTVEGTPAPAFFDTNVLNGNIYRLQGFPATSSGPNFAAAKITQIGTVGHASTNNKNVVRPQGQDS